MSTTAAMFIVLIILLLCLVLSHIIYLIVRKTEVFFTRSFIFILFSAKVAAGSLFGYVYKKYYNGDDTWMLNHDAYLQYQRLLSHPGVFLSEFFSSEPVAADPAIFFHPVTYLGSLEYSLLTKVMAPFNAISQGNYYINIVFFCFLTFWGTYLFYRLLAIQFSHHSKVFAATLFLFPPAAFWLSGLRGEGWIMLFIAMLFYQFHGWLKKRSLVSAALCLVSFGMLFILRSGFALLVLPALFGWWLGEQYKIKRYAAFGLAYGFLFVIVWVCTFLLPPRFNLVVMVIKRQQEFLALHGNTKYQLTALQENLGSFLAVLPQALVNVLLRPFPWEARGALQWLVVVENAVVLTLGWWTLVRFSSGLKSVFSHPLAWALGLFAFSLYLFIGFTVPFPGAIARYRIIPELILVSLLSLSTMKKLKY